MVVKDHTSVITPPLSMASEEPPLTYSRARVTSVFLMAFLKHMSSWFFCVFTTYSAFLLPSASLFPSFTIGQGNIGPFILSRVCACSVASVLSDSVILWTLASGLLCPRDSAGKNIGVSCHALPESGIELATPAFRRILYHWATREVHFAESSPFFHRPLKATSAVVSFESTSKAINSCLFSYIWFALSKTLKIQSKGSSLYPYQNMSAWFCSLLRVEFCFSFTRPNTLLAKLCWSLSLVISLASWKGDVATPGEWGERLSPWKREASISSSPPVEY